jgi:hypothetical protein
LRRLLLRRCWNNAAQNQQSDDCQSMHGIHSNASCHSTIVAVLRGQSRPALRLQFCKCLRRSTEITTSQTCDIFC